jgi:hypothetical protein
LDPLNAQRRGSKRVRAGMFTHSAAATGNPAANISGWLRRFAAARGYDYV